MTRLKRALIGQNPRKTVIRSLLLCIGAGLFFGYLARPVRFDGISMAPTYQDGGYRLMSPLLPRFRGIQRGDVVAIQMPGGRAFYVKRVLGLPGETVGFQKGMLTVNGVLMDEPYISGTGTWAIEGKPVPAYHYFVAGDNRSTSFEGHTLGLVHQRHIAGMVFP